MAVEVVDAGSSAAIRGGLQSGVSGNVLHLQEGHSPGDVLRQLEGQPSAGGGDGRGAAHSSLHSMAAANMPIDPCACACRVLLCGTVPYSQLYAINVYCYCYNGTLTARPSTPSPARRVRACSRCRAVNVERYFQFRDQPRDIATAPCTSCRRASGPPWFVVCYAVLTGRNLCISCPFQSVHFERFPIG